MIKVAGHWEFGFNTPYNEAYYWSMPMRDFKIKDWLMVPVTGIRNQEERSVDLTEFDSYDSLLEYCGDIKRVFLEPRTEHQNPDTIWLHDYTHPEECVYVFGSAHYNPTVFHAREGDDVVSIKTEIDSGLLWSHQCLPIVLYDRMMKQWQ